jgi:hypothetical protein
MSASRHQRRPCSESEQDLLDRRVTSAAVVNVDFAVRDHRKNEHEPDTTIDELFRQAARVISRWTSRSRHSRIFSGNIRSW